MTSNRNREKQLRILLSVGTTWFAFAVLTYFVHIYLRECSQPNLTDIRVLYSVSVIASIILSIGYIFRFFDPSQVGDAFTVLDLGLLASWYAITGAALFAALYFVPGIFLGVDIFGAKSNHSPMRKLGQGFLFIVFWLLTAMLANTSISADPKLVGCTVITILMTSFSSAYSSLNMAGSKFIVDSLAAMVGGFLICGVVALVLALRNVLRQFEEKS